MTDVTANSQSISLGRYLTVLRRRRWAVVVGILLGVLAAVGYLLALPPKWTAATQVNITVISDDPFNAQRSPSDLIDPQTELQTARSSSVLSQAASKLERGETATDLRQQMDATLVDNGTVMRISFKASSERTAEDGADAIAGAYLEFRSAQADGRRNTIRDQLNDRRDQLRRDIQAAQSTIQKSAAGSPRRTQAEADLQVLVAEANSLASQITGLEGLDTSGGSVLTEAADNPIVVTPRRGLTLATGLGLGIVLGMILAFLVNVLDRRVHDAFDVVGASAGPVVGTVDAVRASIPARGADRDAIATTRERLLANFDPDGGVLAVLDLTRGAAPSDFPVNLAIALADVHGAVDLALPGWGHEHVDLVLEGLGMTGLDRDGWANVPELGLTLYTQAALDHQLRGQQIIMLGAGRDTGTHRCLVIAVPPAADRSTYLAAARLADSTILVAEMLATRIGDLAGGATDIQAVRSRLTGTVLMGRRRSVAPAAPESEDRVATHATDDGEKATGPETYRGKGEAERGPVRSGYATGEEGERFDATQDTENDASIHEDDWHPAHVSDAFDQHEDPAEASGQQVGRAGASGLDVAALRGARGQGGKAGRSRSRGRG